MAISTFKIVDNGGSLELIDCSDDVAILESSGDDVMPYNPLDNEFEGTTDEYNSYLASLVFS